MNKLDLKQLENIIRSTFPSSQFDTNILNLKMDDIEEWDSIGNFNLLLAFEEFYNIRFSIEEMSELKSISGIISVLEKKI